MPEMETLTDRKVTCLFQQNLGLLSLYQEPLNVVDKRYQHGVRIDVIRFRKAVVNVAAHPVLDPT
jgi:hypothetical protein